LDIKIKYFFAFCHICFLFNLLVKSFLRIIDVFGFFVDDFKFTVELFKHFVFILHDAAVERYGFFVLLDLVEIGFKYIVLLLHFHLENLQFSIHLFAGTQIVFDVLHVSRVLDVQVVDHGVENGLGFVFVGLVRL